MTIDVAEGEFEQYQLRWFTSFIDKTAQLFVETGEYHSQI